MLNTRDDGWMRSGLKIAVLTSFALFVGAAASAASLPTVVLGSRAFAGPQGAGWGQPHPNEIFNGGDPSGLVTHIRWSNWGGPQRPARARTPSSNLAAAITKSP